MGHISDSSKKRILQQPDRFFIYQVELSSYCNMQCPYCPHPGHDAGEGLYD